MSLASPRLHSRRYPCAFTFYVDDPITSIETRSLPSLSRRYPCAFTFYVDDPITSIDRVINHSSPIFAKSFD
jgi:hypothetical protein